MGSYSPILSVAASYTLLIARLVVMQATELSTLDSNLRGMLRRVSPRSIASPVFHAAEDNPRREHRGLLWCLQRLEKTKYHTFITSVDMSS